MRAKQWNEWLWEAWCIASIIGIWPRYIEPRLLTVTRLNLPIRRLPSEFIGFKILHFTDLHWSHQFSPYLQKKLIRKMNALKPDLIVFTGDMLCRAKLENREVLRLTLCSLKAKIGCFAVLGNHDYADFVTVNAKGDYDVEQPCAASNIGKGFRRLFSSFSLTRQVTARAQNVEYHVDLADLLRETPFRLLKNTTERVCYEGQWMNICGLEEYTLGRCDPEKAFKNYDSRYPGVILCHNPDAFQLLKNCPGDLILSGHTHGGQVNLPFLWKRLTRLECLQFKRGLKRISEKWGYVNRGISSVMKFRWFSIPEVALITLQQG